MSRKRAALLIDPRMDAAVAELQELVREHYPTATFTVGPADEDRAAIHITATVDVDDPDVVTDLVIDRMLDLQIAEGLPVFLIPIRTPERRSSIAARRLSDDALLDDVIRAG